MATKKKATETRTKAAVGRERRLALSLCAVLDSFTGTETGTTPEQMSALEAGHSLLAGLGYGDLESIPLRVARLNDALKVAVEAGDGKLISELGLALERAKAGLPPSKRTAASTLAAAPATDP